MYFSKASKASLHFLAHNEAAFKSKMAQKYPLAKELRSVSPVEQNLNKYEHIFCYLIFFVSR